MEIKIPKIISIIKTYILQVLNRSYHFIESIHGTSVFLSTRFAPLSLLALIWKRLRSLLTNTTNGMRRQFSWPVATESCFLPFFLAEKKSTKFFFFVSGPTTIFYFDTILGGCTYSGQEVKIVHNHTFGYLLPNESIKDLMGLLTMMFWRWILFSRYIINHISHPNKGENWLEHKPLLEYQLWTKV
jgi:hypothetical protein